MQLGKSGQGKKLYTRHRSLIRCLITITQATTEEGKRASRKKISIEFENSSIKKINN